MSTRGRLHPRTGPEELRPPPGPAAGGRAVRCPAGLGARPAECGAAERGAAERGAAERAEPLALLVAADGLPRPAPRRSGHVARAGGRTVPAAGRTVFRRTGVGRTAHAAGNHPPGHCPDPAPDSWHAVARAPARAGAGRPRGSAHAVAPRRRTRCRERGDVRGGGPVRVLRGSDLPPERNATP
ncbi:hypothetical protein ACIF8T_11470 [Streptomyces sp. NPDC085946]|uniref:hypothetical protein n=1 Tax=Streptomyces sp. NPDC085946 TaxID=3365744 RepID=UPI0037CDABB9